MFAKKSVIVSFLAVALLLSISISSAFWPFSIFKGAPVTGNVIDFTNLPDGLNCTDSDGGVYSLVSGKVVYDKRVRRQYNYTDRCITSGSGSGSGGSGGSGQIVRHKLVEYYCNLTKSGSPVQAKSFSCSYGCNNGACLPKPCSDSDRGVSLTVRGTTTGYLDLRHSPVTYSDSCYSPYIAPGRIQEWSCNADQTVRNQSYPCPVGTACSNGACIYNNTINSSNQTSGYPDLIVSNIALVNNSGSILGQSFPTSTVYNILTKVRNIGGVAVNAAGIKLAVSNNGNISRVSAIGDCKPTLALAPGQEVTCDYLNIGGYAFGSDGSHTVIAKIDYYNTLRETSDDNNINQIIVSTYGNVQPPTNNSNSSNMTG